MRNCLGSGSHCWLAQTANRTCQVLGHRNGKLDGSCIYADPPGPAVGDETFGYSYDSIGNREQYTVATPETSDYYANALNQYTWTDYDGPGADARQSLDYDADGNLDTIYISGDLNCDGAFNGADIDPFFLALGDPTVWMPLYYWCNLMLGDMNGDGAVNGADIDVFFECLGGGCP